MRVLVLVSLRHRRRHLEAVLGVGARAQALARLCFAAGQCVFLAAVLVPAAGIVGAGQLEPATDQGLEGRGAGGDDADVLLEAARRNFVSD